MSRIQTEAIAVRPSMNIYTALAVVGTLAAAASVAVLILHAKEIFGGGGLFG